MLSNAKFSDNVDELMAGLSFHNGWCVPAITETERMTLPNTQVTSTSHFFFYLNSSSTNVHQWGKKNVAIFPLCIEIECIHLCLSGP